MTTDQPKKTTTQEIKDHIIFISEDEGESYNTFVVPLKVFKMVELLERAEKIIAQKYFDDKENREWLKVFQEFQNG